MLQSFLRLLKGLIDISFKSSEGNFYFLEGKASSPPFFRFHFFMGGNLTLDFVNNPTNFSMLSF